MTQYRLTKHYSFSAGQVGRLKESMHVSIHTPDTLRTLLGCGISDIIEYIPKRQPAPEEQPVSGIASTGKEVSSKPRRPGSPRDDKPKKSEPEKSLRSKKSDKEAAKDGKEGKEGKESKKNR